jgi:UDP-N-acetylmuramyl pentapeptide synthase
MAIHTVSLQSLGLALDAQGQIEITGLALDNRHIKAGDLFAALLAAPCMAPDLRRPRLMPVRLRC